MIDLLGGTGDANGETDELFSIENVRGTNDRDVIRGNSDVNELHGEGGDDVLIGWGGHDRLFGGAGNDSFRLLDEGEYLTGHLFDGGAGTDTLDLEHNAGNYGDFTVSVTYLDDGDGTGWTGYLESGGFSSAIQATLVSIEDVIGSSLQDRIFGTDGSNVLRGGDGDDDIYGGYYQLYSGLDPSDAGNDTLHGDAGADRLHGFGGNDTMYGGTENDALYGGTGDDHLNGGNGDDTLVGGEGADHIYGGQGIDTFVAIETTEGMTISLADCTTSDGDDLHEIENVSCGAGSDHVYGDGNANVLRGSSGDDEIHGGGGNDTLDGGAHSDTLNGGTGNDTLTGGVGFGYQDTFVFDHQGAGELDVITDFEAYSDRIDLRDTDIGSWNDLNSNWDGDYMFQLGNDIIIHTTGNDIVILNDVQMTSLTADNFIF
jgi:Ca2+-binding RTX toxin-like protein